MQEIERRSGGCSCGAVRYELMHDPILMLNCHCRACRRASGGAYAPLLVLPAKDVRLTGCLRYHTTIGDSGKCVERGFCPNCGSQIAMKLERMPDAICLHAGGLTDPSQYQPSMDVFTANAPAWDHMDPDVEKFLRGFST